MSRSQAAAKCSSSTERAMLASSGERMPPWGVPLLVSLVTPSSERTPACRNAFTSPTTRLSPIATSHPVHQGRVVDLVETGRDVTFEHPGIALGGEHVNLGNRVVSPATRAEAVTTRLEVRLEDRFENQFEAGLHACGPWRWECPGDGVCPFALGIIRSRTASGSETVLP